MVSNGEKNEKKAKKKTKKEPANNNAKSWVQGNGGLCYCLPCFFFVLLLFGRWIQKKNTQHTQFLSLWLFLYKQSFFIWVLGLFILTIIIIFLFVEDIHGFCIHKIWMIAFCSVKMIGMLGVFSDWSGACANKLIGASKWKGQTDKISLLWWAEWVRLVRLHYILL